MFLEKLTEDLIEMFKENILDENKDEFAKKLVETPWDVEGEISAILSDNHEAFSVESFKKDQTSRIIKGLENYLYKEIKKLKTSKRIKSCIERRKS